MLQHARNTGQVDELKIKNYNFNDPSFTSGLLQRRIWMVKGVFIFLPKLKNCSTEREEKGMLWIAISVMLVVACGMWQHPVKVIIV